MRLGCLSAYALSLTRWSAITPRPTHALFRCSALVPVCDPSMPCNIDHADATLAPVRPFGRCVTNASLLALRSGYFLGERRGDADAP